MALKGIYEPKELVDVLDPTLQRFRVQLQQLAHDGHSQQSRSIRQGYRRCLVRPNAL
jgi:hypothetical protein